MRQTVIIGVISALLAMVVLAGTAAAQERKVALVVGNGAYANTTVLPNPSNDARAMSEVLEGLGFEVMTGIDTNMSELRNLVQDFGGKLNGVDVAMFFYAGHGFQVSGSNFLVPVDAEIREETDIEFEALNLDLVLGQMERRARIKIVLLDACRNNPFETVLSRSMGATRSAALGRGLAPVQPAGGALIGFATDPGNVALDGSGQNSPFTTALLRHLSTPGLEINVVMTRVRADVFRNSGERQRPWTTSSLIGELYLNGPAASLLPQADDIAAWKAADASGRIEAMEAYLANFPSGLFRELAESRLVEAETAAGDKVAMVAATPVPQASEPKSATEELRHFVDCMGCPEMITLPGGTFMMGEDFGPDWEKPRSARTIPAAFSIARTEVTRAEWALCAADNACRRLPGAADNVPAAGLSAEDAEAYVAWLTQKTGRTYRLPSEAEWEFAARGGRGARYPTGPVLAPRMAHYGAQDAAPMTVASFAANTFGLHDLGGNVWEWVADCGAFYAQTGPTASAVVAAPCIRVMRGGGFRSTAHELRSANRYFVQSQGGRDDYGMRVAADVAN